MIEVAVEQMMTEDLITVEPSQSLADAGQTMTEADIKSVVVSDAAERPTGILTSTDFVRMAAEGTEPSEQTVAEAMTEDIVTATPETPVRAAADLMIDNTISHLPVVDDDGRLVGIVTTTDVSAYVSRAGELPRQQ